MSLETKTLKIVGNQTMHCGGCERNVKFTLSQLPGVQQVKASHKTQLIDLTLDTGTVDIERIRKELDWIGYLIAEVEDG